MLGKIIKQVKGSAIPIISINGPINNVTTESVENRLRNIDPSVSKALAVTVNSSGGLPVQSQIISKKLRQYARKNHLKLFTFAKDLVASGGYLVLASGDQIYCDSSSIIGSIGVTMPKYEIKGALDSFDIEHKIIRSGNNMLGQSMSPYHNINPEEQQKIRQVCRSLHMQLVQQIKSIRGNKLKQNDNVFDGTLFTANQSKEIGLVDGIGSYMEILDKKYPGVKLEIDRNSSFFDKLLSS